MGRRMKDTVYEFVDVAMCICVGMLTIRERRKVRGEERQPMRTLKYHKKGLNGVGERERLCVRALPYTMLAFKKKIYIYRKE